MNFDKTELKTAYGRKWLDRKLEGLRESVKEDIEYGEEPRCELAAVKPNMPFNYDLDMEDFITFYEFKTVAWDNDLICFRHYAYEDYDDLDSYPKTLHGHAALIEFLIEKYNQRLAEIAAMSPLDAVRKTWLFLEPDVAEMLVRGGEDPWQWVLTVIKEDTPFDRVGKTEGLPDIQSKIDQDMEDGSLKDALMDMHGPQDRTFEIKRNMLEVIENSLQADLIPGYAKAKNGGVKEWMPLEKERDKKLEAMQTFGDMVETFKELQNGKT